MNFKHQTLLSKVRLLSEALARCSYPGYTFHSCTDYNVFEIWATYEEADTATGKVEVQETRHWISPLENGPNAVVSTAFKCVLTSMEHRTREWFLYRERAIYQPHYDVEQLHAICEDREVFA
jgi:hypothetical protein